MVLIVWVYYSAQIFFFGAEFTRVYAESGAAEVAEPQPEPLEDRAMRDKGAPGAPGRGHY